MASVGPNSAVITFTSCDPNAISARNQSVDARKRAEIARLVGDRRRRGGRRFRRIVDRAALTGLGHDVVVLEGRDRVGGRSYTDDDRRRARSTSARTFVGPTQDEVLALAAELGCQTVPTHNTART